MQTKTAEPTKDKLKRNWMKVAGCLAAYFVLVAVIVVGAAYIVALYCEKSMNRDKPDRTADGSIAQIIKHNYNDSRSLTREEVILIISDMFFRLNQKDFEEIEDPNVAIGQALIKKILEGDESGYRIKDQVTKEEALTFIGRCLDIPEYLGTESDFPDGIDCADWAEQPIEMLIDQDCLSVNEILELGDLHQVITVSDLKFVLYKVAEAKIEEQNSWRYAVLNRPFFQLATLVWALISAVGLPRVKKVILGQNQSQRGKEQKQQEEEQKRQEEEQRKREEEQKRQEEEQKRREEEQKRQEEEQRKREEEQKRQEEEQKRQEEEQKRQEEEQKRQKEERKRQKEERKRQKEERKDEGWLGLGFA